MGETMEEGMDPDLAAHGHRTAKRPSAFPALENHGYRRFKIGGGCLFAAVARLRITRGLTALAPTGYERNPWELTAESEEEKRWSLVERCLLLLTGQALVCEVASLKILVDEVGQFIQEVSALVDHVV